MIPLIDIQRQHQSLREELEKEIRDVLERGQFILGKASEALEKEVATLCGTQYGIGVNSGTDALFLALTAWGVGEGDEVITSPYTFFATIEAIVQTGARPVLVDIEPRNYQLDPDQVEQAITSQTQAILPVHLFGHPADMKALSSIAQRHRLAVVEDACQAIGAQLDGQPVGSWGDIGCFSFYPTKNLGGVGGETFAEMESATASFSQSLSGCVSLIAGSTSLHLYEGVASLSLVYCADDAQRLIEKMVERPWYWL